MQVAILSDIHGNVEALQAVLDACRARSVGRIICLGDIVGYGANPEACIESVFANADVIVAGNHDRAVVGLEDLAYMNGMAVEAIRWTSDRLSDRHAVLLSALPLKHRERNRLFVHGSPSDPELFPYIFTGSEAEAAMTATDAVLTFVGHSHRAFVCREGAGEVVAVQGGYDDRSARRLVNVGSVGQPRDRDPRACFCLMDDETEQLELVRVPYDVAAAQNKILEAGLPRYLADRLESGS